MRGRTVVLTAMTLVAFASNSLLCRLALAGRRIDAGSFTALRLASGAVALALLLGLRNRRRGTSAPLPGSWASALALFLYAAPFSFAYLSLPAGTGALVLFGAVQLTMVGWSVYGGERPPALTWLGLALALGGLVGLTAPGAKAADPVGAVSMALAGVAWGVYSLRGRSAVDPLGSTAGNFVRSVPFAGALLLANAFLEPHGTMEGAALAVSSGALASGLGYALWYTVLPSIPASRAAVLQILVPVIAALGGVAVLGEALSLRLVIAGSVVLTGVGLALVTRQRNAQGPAQR